jgi:hypothetical protein
MPVVEIQEIEKYRQTSLPPLGRVLEPLPVAQTQQGPNCGFYALSIVMEYWKAMGRVANTFPARKRDVPADDAVKQDVQSLRNLGKSVGALTMAGSGQTSTGGVFDAAQLAEVAKAADFVAKVFSPSTHDGFLKVVCKSIDGQVPPIIAFDVEKGDPVQSGGQNSHWGVIVGYYHDKDVLHLLATHGHGKYYTWPANSLAESSFGLQKTTRKIAAEAKVRLTRGGRAGGQSPLMHWHWANKEALVKYSETVAKSKLGEAPSEKQFAIERKADVAVRPEVDVAQNIGGQIVLVVPKASGT